MNKRGVSTIVSAVLILCTGVLLAVIILAWGGAFSKGLLKHADETNAKLSACETETNVNIKYACFKDGKITLMVESLGSKKVKGLIVRVLGSSGGYQRDIETEMNVADLKRFEVINGEIGGITSIEVLPKVEILGKREVCGVKDRELNIAEC